MVEIVPTGCHCCKMSRKNNIGVMDFLSIQSHCVYELSPYERKRLENIQRNAAMFAELNLHEVLIFITKCK